MTKETIFKYLLNELSDQEARTFEKWVFESQENMRTFADYKNAWSLTMADLEEEKVSLENNYKELQHRINSKRRKKLNKISRFLKYAAVIFLIAGLTALLVNQWVGKAPFQKYAMELSKIEPGTRKAMLLLENGRYIPLDSASAGAITTVDHKHIAELDKGQIVYSSSKEERGKRVKEIIYNTIIIPRGGEYKLVLSDGTCVWLNSETEIKYPVEFSGKTREVLLVRGEAYFEVARNEKVPFLVSFNDSLKVKVLGTHFNINAYEDDPVARTTLLEGSVEVTSASGYASVLRPGQQLRLGQNGTKELANVNVNEVVAWKNGDFFFDNENLESIMKKLSRWYDVPFKFKDEKLKNIQFFGIIKRHENINSILEMLKITKMVEFRIVDGTIEIWPARR
jgi:ferric-dicitrate binding protein FerR (iron transport regulator)